mmetsp:Transcript_40082/g.87539  ORF Transcript_40082/g.87539 Transcript_40082/m.87539 type:complete len:372 (-) Transcript_40082:19-1134(-)
MLVGSAQLVVDGEDAAGSPIATVAPLPPVPVALNLLAGAGAGAVQTVLWHPLDVLKTRLQVQGARLAHLPAYTSLLHVARSTSKAEGVGGFFRGVGPNLLGSSLAWGLQMPVYTHLKRSSALVLGEEQQLLRDLACSTAASCLACFLVHPVFLIKTRLQLQVSSPARAVSSATPPVAGTAASAAKAGLAASAASSAGAAAATGPGASAPSRAPQDYRSSLHAACRIVQEEGPVGLYRGFGPSLLLASHGAVLLMAYDQLRLVCPSVMAASCLAKVLATTSTYPLQVVRSVMQQRPDVGSSGYSHMAEACRAMWQRDGIRAFYRGIDAQMLRTVPQAMAFFSIYEWTFGQLSGIWHSRRACETAAASSTKWP